jgi:hypothetical protein
MELCLCKRTAITPVLHLISNKLDWLSFLPVYFNASDMIFFSLLVVSVAELCSEFCSKFFRSALTDVWEAKCYT